MDSDEVTIMKKLIGMALVLLSAIAASACGAPAQKDPATPPGGAEAAQGETCPTVSAGPPAVCPQGCEWNGNECRKHSPIVVYGLPAPSSSVPSAPIAPVTSPTPSSP